jgi:4-oxalocrotonate tautomerase
MPFVNIKIIREGATREQKEKLIQGATQILVDVLGKNPAATVVVIEKVETDMWGMEGESVTT